MQFENKGKWTKQILESLANKNEADNEDLSKDIKKAIDDLEKFAKSKHMKLPYSKEETKINTGLHDPAHHNKINFAFSVDLAKNKIYLAFNVEGDLNSLTFKIKDPLEELELTRSNIFKGVEIIKSNYNKLESLVNDEINAWKDFGNSAGSFEKALAQTFELADKRNLEKLCSIYPELGQKFAIWKSSGWTSSYKKL